MTTAFSTARPLMNTRWLARVARLTPGLPMNPVILSPPGGTCRGASIGVNSAAASSPARSRMRSSSRRTPGSWNTVRPSRT